MCIWKLQISFLWTWDFLRLKLILKRFCSENDIKATVTKQTSWCWRNQKKTKILEFSFKFWLAAPGSIIWTKEMRRVYLPKLRIYGSNPLINHHRAISTGYSPLPHSLNLQDGRGDHIKVRVPSVSSLGNLSPLSQAYLQ